MGTVIKDKEDYIKRNLPQSGVSQMVDEIAGSGTEVIANPELSGDEETLDSIQIGEEKYVVPAGAGSTTDVQINGNSITSGRVANIVTESEYDESTNPIATISDIPTDYQTEIDSDHKLSADLIDDESSTNKFVTVEEKSAWDDKQDELVSGENIKTINGTSILGEGDFVIESNPAPYVVQDYQLDLDEMEFECSDADAEHIFTNNPIAISLDGIVAVARDFTDDESKSDYSRSYTFFEYPDDDQIIVYELALYWDGEEYSFDIKPTDPIGGGGGGITVPTFTPTTFEIELPDVDIALSSQDCADIIQNEYPIITISQAGENETISLTFVRNNAISGIEKGEPYTNLQYDLVVDDDEDVYLVGLSFSDNDMKSWCMEITGGGSGSEVSGTNDGTNWTTLTIDGTTKNIPAGGSSAEEIYPITITATPNSTNIELAPAQNITLQDMGQEAPGYTAASYQTLNPVSYNKSYDAVLVEFHAGHQYLLPLISADSSMLMYGIAESSMPVFDADHPCAILIQLNNGAVDSVMMISNSEYGPSGTLVATSLKGYFYSDTEFSFDASGISDTDITTAISAGKIPVAIINWRYKDYQSWCEIKSFDEEDYSFEGEYKGSKFVLICDGSYWRINWSPIYIEDKQLAADVDYANNKIYFRSLDAMRAMQSGLPMVKLELHDYTALDKTPILDYLELNLASQSDDKSECYYTSTQIKNGVVTTTTIYVASGHTYVSGSSIYTKTGEGVTDVQINGTSIISSGVANIVTETAYNASTNKIATISDLPVIDNPLSGKKVSLIGDSITTWSTVKPDNTYQSRYPSGVIQNINQTWWYQMIENGGMTLLRNTAYNGSSCTGRDGSNGHNTSSTTDPYAACSDKRINDLSDGVSNPDIVICFIGINDFGSDKNTPVGNYIGLESVPADSTSGMATFSEGYGLMLKKIMTKYPQAHVYCCTLPSVGHGSVADTYTSRWFGSAFPVYNTTTHAFLSDYNNTIRTLAHNMGAAIIEFSECISWFNSATYLEDGLHPNIAGMQLLGNKALAKLQSDFAK